MATNVSCDRCGKPVSQPTTTSRYGIPIYPGTVTFYRLEPKVRVKKELCITCTDSLDEWLGSNDSTTPA